MEGFSESHRWPDKSERCYLRGRRPLHNGASHLDYVPESFPGSGRAEKALKNQQSYNQSYAADDYMGYEEDDDGEEGREIYDDELSNVIEELPNYTIEGDQLIRDDSFSWVTDSYTTLVSDMKKANLIKDNRVGILKVHRNSFKGQDFVEWIMKERGIKTSEALELGQELIDRHFGQQTSREMGETFSPDRFYQLVEDDENKPLNSGKPSSEDPLTVRECNETLVNIIRPIYADILTDEGRTVQYHKLIDNAHFSRYLSYCKEISRVDMEHATDDDRIALLVNVYNMMMIHTTQKMGPPVGVWARRKVFNSTYYIIGGHNYSLNSIMNGILRGNKKGNGYLWKPLGKQDMRLPLIIPGGEPLIFFGVNNGTRHAPPLRAYTVDNVREELLQQAIELLNSEEYLKIDIKKNVLHLSKIFKWYAEDFGGVPEKIVEWIVEALQGSNTEKAKQVETMFIKGEYRIDYQHYDWSYNGVERLTQPLRARGATTDRDRPDILIGQPFYNNHVKYEAESLPCTPITPLN